MSFTEYVNAYYKGGLDISKRYGISKAADEATTADTAYFNTMYGATVFNQLNTKSDVFKLFRKEGWNQSGWRVLTARSAAASNKGIGEGGTFGATGNDVEGDIPDLAQVKADVKEIVSPFTVTTRAAILAEADDGVKGLAAFLRAQAAEAHSFYIDKSLCADPATAAVPASLHDMTPLMRITGNNDQLGLTGVDANEMDLYDLDRDAGATWADAFVEDANGTNRLLSLELLDNAIQSAIENGASYQNLIFLTGHTQLAELKRLILAGGPSNNGVFRMMMESANPKGTNGVASEPGQNLETRVGYYDSIPIYATQHLATALTGSSGGTGMGPILLLDMEHLSLKIAAPTTFLAQEDLANVQALKRNYAFMTAGEMICYKFASQGMIRDLKSA